MMMMMIITVVRAHIPFKAFQSEKRLISIYCMQIYKQMIRRFAVSFCKI